MGVKPLTVAIAAMALLVASVGFEVVFDRTFTLAVETGTGYAQIGASSRAGYAKPIDTRAGGDVRANESDALRFRLEVDNGYPWSFSEAYDVRVNGIIVAEGILEAPARGAGEATFEVPASAFLAHAPQDVGAIPAYLEIQVGEEFVSGNFQIQEVS